MDLGWDHSPAAYLRAHRSEFADGDWEEVLQAALETGLALESGHPARARRAWAHVLAAAEHTGRSAFRDGSGTGRLIGAVGRVRDAVDLVLFDGRLPADLASRASRVVSKMSGRWLDQALAAYWEDRATGG